MFGLFNRKPDVRVAASELGKLGAAARHARARAKIRAVADEMRVNAGLPPVEWPAL